MRAVLIASLGLAACHPPPLPPYPTDLRDSSTIEPEFMMRQTITFERSGRSMTFQAVLQNHDGRLILLALNPIGGRGFSIEQRSTEVVFQSFDGTELPFPPRYIFNDIHRALFLGMDVGRIEEGPSEWSLPGERARDQWRAGKLLSRTFEMVAPHECSPIRIDYGEGYTPGTAPPVIHFDNGWLGYRLTIETTAFEVLRRP